MEIQPITQQMYEALKQPLPQEAISQHGSKSYLSSIKSIYVTERFNEVFGCGAWRIKTEHIATNQKGMVIVKVTFEVPKYGVYYECFGGNDNGGEQSKGYDMGDAFKGATTDAITKIGSYLGVGIDVFKGKVTNTPPPAQRQQSPSNGQFSDKKWLNVLDAQNNMTREWTNLMNAIAEKRITSVAQVREHYKVSKEVEDKIQSLLK